MPSGNICLKAKHHACHIRVKIPHPDGSSAHKMPAAQLQCEVDARIPINVPLEVFICFPYYFFSLQ